MAPFVEKNTQAGSTFSNVTWQHSTALCLHSPPRGIGHTVHKQQDKTRSDGSPNMVYRRLLVYNQARNVSIGLDRLE